MSISPPQLPPTFKNSSPVANGLALTRDQLEFFSRLNDEAGDFAHYELLNGITYVINDPALVREILSGQEENYRKLAFPHASEILGHGLLGSQGELHRHMRKITRPPLQQNRMAHYGTQMVDLANERLKNWRAGEIDLSRELELLTLEIVGQLLFSVRLGNRAEQIVDLSHTLQRLSERPRTAPDDQRAFSEANTKLSRIGRQIFEERSRSPASDDLLSHLLLAQQQDAGAISADQVLQEVRTIVMAGHVTTANTIASALWLLAQNSTAEKQLRDEIDEKIGARTPTPDDLDLLPFCEMVFSETLRLYPPVWIFGRETLRQVTLRQYTLPPGARILIIPWLLHRDPRFFDEPEKFNPERWRDDARARLPRCCYLPFSIGSRSCLGERFALMEAKLVLAHIVQRWKVRQLPSKPDPGWTTQIVYWPSRGIRLLLEPRSS